MYDGGTDARRRHRVGELRKEVVVVALIDSDAALNRDRKMSRIAHAAHAIRDQRGLEHETCAERAVLHAITRATHIQIDFRIACGRADARRLAELRGIASAELQRHRMLAAI